MLTLLSFHFMDMANYFGKVHDYQLGLLGVIATYFYYECQNNNGALNLLYHVYVNEEYK